MLWKEAKALQNNLVIWRRHLHRIPEVGLDLPETRAALCNILEGMGVPFLPCQNTSGIKVLVSGRPGSETVALRSDMDALPIQELADVPFASRNVAMHACGHDAHMAMLLGAIKLLHERRDEFPGTVVCIFQPGEEGFHGAEAMVAEGVLEHPHTDTVIGLHVTPDIPELAPGAIGYRSGPLMAGSDVFLITVTGLGGHISDAKIVRSPFTAVAKITLMIQEKCRRLIDSGEKAIIAVGVLQGGEKENIVPDEARIRGSIRFLDRKVQGNLKQWLQEICDRVGAEERCSISLRYTCSSHMVYNDRELTEFSAKTVRQMAPEIHGVEIVSELMASDDISAFFEKGRGTYLHLGCGFEDGTNAYSLHNARFLLNEDVLWHGSAVLAQCAVNWLNRSAEYR